VSLERLVTRAGPSDKRGAGGAPWRQDIVVSVSTSMSMSIVIASV
jgi:hypothetical protein